MSSKSAKKKRLGSRRVAPNQNVTDDSSVPQHHVLEESSESLNVSSNPDNSKPETQQPPSPDVTMNRRKLGSSRRNKGRQFAKDSETEPYLEPREEVEEKTTGNKTVTITQSSTAAQLDRQEESSQGSVQHISATPESSWSSASTPDYYYSEVKSPNTLNSPEDVTEILTSNTGNLQAEQAHENETKLEKTDKWDTLQSAEMEENVGIPELSHLGLLASLSADQQLINIQPSNSREMPEEELSLVYSVAEMGSNKNYDADLFRQDESLQGNTLESVSQVGSVAVESIADKSSPRENTAIKDSVEQAIFLFPKEELPTNEKVEERFNLSELEEDQHLEDIVNKVQEQDFEAIQMQKVHENDYSPESRIFDATENADTCSGHLKDQAEIRDTYQFELSGKITNDFAAKQEVSNPGDQQYEHPTKVDNLEADVKDDNSVGATLEGVDKSDTGAHQSEEDAKKVQEDEGKTTEMLQIDNLSSSAIGDATNNLQINELVATLPSEVMVKSTDDSPTKQEVSNPDDKQDEHPNAADNLEALDQRSDDYPSNDTKTPQTSDIERLDTALVQLSESEGRVQDDIRPDPEQMFHHETQQVFSEMEDSKSSLQSFQFETTIVVDSHPHDNSAGIDEDTNTGFHQSGIRRKMGSSRRNKGRQRVQGNEPTEESDGNTGGQEASETTEIPLTTETLLEGMNKFDTHQTQEENTHIDTHVCTSELTKIGKHSGPAVDQQIIDPSHSRQMPDEDLLGVHSVTDTENKERDEHTELLRLDGNLPEDPWMSKTHVSPITMEISTDKSNPEEHTEPEFSAEKATDSSPKDELPAKEEQLSDVRDAQHSEDAVKKVHGEDIQPAQIEDEEQNNYSPEGLILDATENVHTSFGNLKDQTEIRDTYQSELSVKVTDDSAPKQEVSNPDDKQDEHPTQESLLEALDQTNEDFDVSDSKQPLIKNTEREDTARGQMTKSEGQVYDDVKHEDEQTVHQDNEGVLSDVEKSTFSLPTLPSEMDAHFDSNRQDTSVSVEEQTNSGFNLSGNRRKLGSSRRNKGRQKVKESKEEVSENTTSDEAFKITNTSSATETTGQADFSQVTKHNAMPSLSLDSSMFSVSAPGYSSEVPKPAATNHPEADMGSLISKSENLQEDQVDRERDFKEVSDKSVVGTLEGVDKSDTGAHQSEEDAKKVQEDEGKTTEMLQIDNLSASAIGDATDNLQIDELVATLPSEVMVKSTDDSTTKQEVSNPDDKQDEHPNTADNLEALDQRSDDYPSDDTKTPQTSDIERLDTALVQLSESEGRIQDDIRPDPEQMFHHETQQLFSEMEDSQSSLQSFQFETTIVVDSQPHDNSAGLDEETNTGFHQSGIRRKMGSSRRNKGRQRVQGNEPTEESDGNTGGQEASETTEIPLTTETLLEGMNKFDTHQTQEENMHIDTHVCTSELTTIGKHSGPAVDQQIIDPSHCKQMPDEDLLGVHSVTDTENKERDEHTELLRLDGNLPEDPWMSKTHVSPITMEISTDKSNPEEHTEPEFSAEKATDSSPKDELPAKEEQLSDVRDAQHSEDAVKKVHGEDIQPAQIEDEEQNNYSPEGLILDATENVHTSFGNLKDQTEIRDTYQSELSVKVTDDSAPKQEVSNPDDKQDEHPTQESLLEALDQTNEDFDASDSKQPLIKNTEREDTARGQMTKSEGQVYDDVKHEDEQTVHQDNEGVLSDVEKSTFSLPTLPSEMDAHFDSNCQDTSVSVEEQTNSGFNLSGNRRKLGSSRRNKGRQKVKESKEEVSENTTSDEAFEITNTSLATETTGQADFSQVTKHNAMPSLSLDSSMFSVSAPGYSSEVPKPAATNHPEADMGSLISKSENLQEDQVDRERDFKEVSDRSVVGTLEGVDKSDTSAHQSEEDAKKVQEDEGKTTEMLQIDNLSASAIGDATDNLQIDELVATLPSEVMVKRTDDSPTKQEVSNPDDKQDEHPNTADNLEALDQRSDDYPSNDTKTPQTSDIERLDTALVQLSESEGRVQDDRRPDPEQMFHHETQQLFSEMEDSQSSLQSFQFETTIVVDSQPHDNSAGIDEDTNTGFHQSGIRRKMGSSRRNKGRQRVQGNEPTEESDGNTGGQEASETTEIPLTTETLLEGMNKFDTHQTQEENRQLPDENLLDVYSVADTEKGRDGAQRSEDTVKKVHEQEIKLTQMQETPQIDNTSGSVIDDATKNTETFIDQIEIRGKYQSELTVKSTDDDTKDINFESSDQGNEADHVSDVKKPQLSDTERVDTALDDYEIEGQVKDDIKPSAGKTGRQEAGFFSEMEDSESSFQSLQYELHAALDSKPQQNNTSFSSDGNTRKLGSSQEKSMETMLEGMDKSDGAQIKETVHVEQHEHFGPPDGFSDFSSSSLHSSPVVDRQLVESNSSETPDKRLPMTSSATKYKEKDENTELLRQDGCSQSSDSFSESHVESENIESPSTTDITTQKSSSREHTEVESSVEQSSKSSPKKELASSGEQNEYFNPFEVTGAEQSEDVLNEVHEELINPTQVQELLQIDTGNKSCLQALPSEINTPLDSQQQDNPQSIKDESPTGPTPAGSRRKLGSSRRNKGRQHAKEEAVENTRTDEATETPNISLATETARQKELKNPKSPENVRKISSTVNEDENTDKLPDKDTFCTVVPTDISSRSDNDFLKSNEDVDDKENTFFKEPENLSHLTGSDTVKMDLMQLQQASVRKDDLHSQNISYHDDSVNARPSTVDILAKEESSQPQNTEDLLKQDIQLQQTNDVIETGGFVTMDSSVVRQGTWQGEAGGKAEDSTNKFDANKEIDTLHKLDSDEQETVEDVQSGLSSTMDASNSQEEKLQSEECKNLSVKSNQKRRKMGSTRRNKLNRKQEGEMNDKDETTESGVHTETDVRNLDEMEDVKELVLAADVSQNENAPTLLGAVYKEQQEGNETSSAHDEGHQLESSTSNLQSTESNVIPGGDDLMALIPEPSASHTEEVVNLDRKDGEMNVDVGVEPPQLDETQTTPVIAERNRRSIDQLLPPSTENPTNTGITDGSSVLSVTTEIAQNDNERPETTEVIQDQDSNEQKPNTVIEEAQVKIPEMKNASPNLTPTNRRRKMGSTRRNLGSRTKGEVLDNEATETEITVGDVKTESVPGIKEKDLQLPTEHKEGDPEQERLLERVERSQADESQLTPPAQQTVEENPVSQGQPLDADQLTPNYLPSTSPKNDTMSVSASGGRRRKMGSHRKSRGHQGYGDQTEEKEGILDAQNGTDVKSITEEGAINPTGERREEPLGLHKIPEVDDRDKQPSSDIIISTAGEHSRPVSEKTSFQPSRAENRPGQEQFSLAGEPGVAGLRSDSYHVVMIGDSSVGKTSFMKRAQTGKFSLDTPASIGLDSCMWTVVVDGKPVVLELWDTAGQERFRSITRHIFHKAQAFLLMYDITCAESFSAVSYWANCIQESAAEDVTVLLLGNKSDCAQRQVKMEQGEILAKEYNFEFMECSAATGENVVQCLETVARMLNERIGTREEAAVFHHEAGQKKKSTCC